jgi:hypothetical protein
MNKKWKVYAFVTSAIDGSELTVSLPGLFVLGEKSPVPIEQEVKWTPESGLGGVEITKAFAFAKNLNPGVMTLTGHFTDSDLSTQICSLFKNG